MKKIIAFFAFLSWLLTATAQEEKEMLQHTPSWPAAFQKAQKENKLVFVDTYFTGCHPCAQMDKEVFPNEVVSKELNENFVGIKVDVFKEKLGDSINLQYGLSGFPTFLILDQSGRLVSMFSGFNDAGKLMLELSRARQKAAKKEFLSGFAAAYSGAYPEFYKKFYDREDRKIDPAAASAWIKQQKDWTKEQVALPMLKMGGLGPEIEDYLLKNYTTYRALYGESLVLGRTSSILNARMKAAVGKQKNDAAFEAFLAANAKNFPAEDWTVFRYLLGNDYYGALAKDTVALLRFMNEAPVVYMNYFGALYNTMLVRKQLNETTLPLLCTWVDKAVTAEAPLDLISTAAFLHKQNNNTEGYKRFVNMGLEKAKKYKMPTDVLERMLASN